MLKELLRVGAQAVQEVISDLYPGMRTGLVYTVHTAGRDLGYKPHVQLVITKGGLIDGKWVEIESVPAARLSSKWSFLLCKRIRELRPSDTVLQQVIAKTYNDYRGFMVHTESIYPKGVDAARYIGRYLGHPPLATSHLLDYDGQRVTFWYKDTQTGERQIIRCSAMDFISYMVPHIPPKGLQIVRYAGLYARCIKRRCADIANTTLEALREQISLFATETLLKVVTLLKWQERIKASFGYACPRPAGQGPIILPQVWSHDGTCGDLGATARLCLDACPGPAGQGSAGWRRTVYGKQPEMPRKMHLPNKSAARAHLASISNCRSSGTHPEKLVRHISLSPLRQPS